MQRVHTMPFGTEILAPSATRFRLWAPSASRVDLYMPGQAQNQQIQMESDDNGWFEIISQTAPAGTAYRFLIDEELLVPDPASRYQPEDVNGPSIVVDPSTFQWQDNYWTGRPWNEAVIYELHTGTFTDKGTFSGIKEKLDHLVELGVTAVELMPLAQFPGRWGWGYDGVLPFAPHSRYGSPHDLKDLVQVAHQKGLMVFLDVVYNHFGPEGNYLTSYCKPFFSDKYATPWGQAINYDGPSSQWVRRFIIDNALYWLTEYNLDGLRLDAVNTIFDNSGKHILEELAEAVHLGPGKTRHVHLVLENDRNDPRLLSRDKAGRPYWYTAQWNDDFHHAIHVLCTGEKTGYYADYNGAASQRSAIERLGRTVALGFDYQGDRSLFRAGAGRGYPCAHLPACSFVTFIQNHDQAGNRAFGERLLALSGEEAAKAAAAILLLSPHPPLLFMGEEWGTRKPFQFFSDLGPELAPLVSEGRRKEFARFADFADPGKRETIPDPCREETFKSSILNWPEICDSTHHQWCLLYKHLLSLRKDIIAPVADELRGLDADFAWAEPGLLSVTWSIKQVPMLAMLANMSPTRAPAIPAEILENCSSCLKKGNLFFQTMEDDWECLQSGSMNPFAVLWFKGDVPSSLTL